ncbi:MAG: leucine-rich repeat domain-containing protein [Ruminococcus sp.]
MKKIISALLTITMMFALIATGCSSNSGSSTSSETSSNTSSNSSSSETSGGAENANLDSDFVWEEGKYIVDLSEEGQKKKEIVIPENCQNIMISTTKSASGTGFNNNDNIESISFKNTKLTLLPSFLLQFDTNLSNIELPDTLKKIPKNFAAGCTSLKTLEIPVGVTEIGDSAFNSSGIEELKIPEGVTTIGDAVFHLTQIKKLYLPESLTDIDNQFLGMIDNLDDNMKLKFKLEIYVKEGSYADKNFTDFADSTIYYEKKYY